MIFIPEIMVVGIMLIEDTIGSLYPDRPLVPFIQFPAGVTWKWECPVSGQAAFKGRRPLQPPMMTSGKPRQNRPPFKVK